MEFQEISISITGAEKSTEYRKNEYNRYLPHVGSSKKTKFMKLAYVFIFSPECMQNKYKGDSAEGEFTFKKMVCRTCGV